MLCRLVYLLGLKHQVQGCLNSAGGKSNSQVHSKNLGKGEPNYNAEDEKI